MNDYLNLKNNI